MAAPTVTLSIRPNRTTLRLTASRPCNFSFDDPTGLSLSASAGAISVPGGAASNGPTLTYDLPLSRELDPAETALGSWDGSAGNAITADDTDEAVASFADAAVDDAPVTPDAFRVWKAGNDSVFAANRVQATPDDSGVYALDLTDQLPSGVTVSGGTLAQKLDDGTASTALTLSDAAYPNPETITNHKGQTVAVGKALLFSIEGGDGGADYLITVTPNRSDGTGRAVVCRFEVRDGDEEA